MRNCARSALEIPEIPNELIAEILPWLPVKTLMRFRCVSKSWYSLISSPQFITAHLKKSANDPDYTHHKLVMCDSFKKELRQCSLHPALYAPIAEATNLCYLENEHLVDFVGCCNGLICVRLGKEIFLWNPAIRKSKKLPCSVPAMENMIYCFYHIGYDEFSDDYKVFQFRHHFDLKDGKTWVDVYSLKTDSWKSVDYFEGDYPFHGVCFVSGKLHRSTYRNKTLSIIVSIDLAGGTRGEVEQPEYLEDAFDWTLDVVGGCLSVICCYSSNRVDMWSMKEYGVKESWTRVGLVVPNFDGETHVNLYQPGSGFQSKNGEFLFVFGPRVMLYRPNRNKVTYRCIVNLGDTRHVRIFIESLVLLNEHDGVERPRARRAGQHLLH